MKSTTLVLTTVNAPYSEQLDAQTLAGKAVFEVATRCRQGGVPCYAVVGADEMDAFEHRLLNLEVEAGTRAGRVAHPEDLERAAVRVARRLLGA